MFGYAILFVKSFWKVGPKHAPIQIPIVIMNGGIVRVQCLLVTPIDTVYGYTTLVELNLRSEMRPGRPYSI